MCYVEFYTIRAAEHLQRQRTPYLIQYYDRYNYCGSIQKFRRFLTATQGSVCTVTTAINGVLLMERAKVNKIWTLQLKRLFGARYRFEILLFQTLWLSSSLSSSIQNDLCIRSFVAARLRTCAIDLDLKMSSADLTFH